MDACRTTHAAGMARLVAATPARRQLRSETFALATSSFQADVSSDEPKQMHITTVAMCREDRTLWNLKSIPGNCPATT
jgi:hypothetical protein